MGRMTKTGVACEDGGAGGGGAGNVASVVAGAGIDVDATDPDNPTVSIGTGEVTLAMMANLAQDKFIVRTTASTGVPETATCTAAARTVLDDTTVAAMVDTLGGASSTGTGGLVRATSPTLVTPALGTPSSGTLTNCTGLPVSTGVSGLGTGVATALAVNVGSAGAPVTNGGALGTPSSGTLTNCTGLPTAGLVDDAVTLAKMAAGTAGNLITYDASGNPAAVATGTAGHVLTSNGAGLAPTFQAGGGGGATTALDNLAAVAINTSLISDTANTDDLGSSAVPWRNGYVQDLTIKDDVNSAMLTFDVATPSNACEIVRGSLVAALCGSPAQWVFTGGDLGVVATGKVMYDASKFAAGDSFDAKTAATRGEFYRRYDDVEILNCADRIETTDNTATTIWDETLGDNSVHVIEALVVGRRTDSAGRWSGRRRVTVYRAGGGATLDGSVETLGTDIATNITPTVTFDASSNDVRCRVTSEVGKTVQWRVFIQKVHSA